MIIEVSGLNAETMTAAAVKDAVRAHPGATEFLTAQSLQHSYHYVPCFETVWRAFARDWTRALMPIMIPAGYVSVMPRS